MKIFLAILLFAVSGAGTQSPSEHRLAASLQRKLDYIHENGQARRPSSAPTIMTEDEINDYFAAGNMKIPPGVKKITLEGKSGTIWALAVIDFDEIRAGQRSSNPLLAMFSGLHNVNIEADAAGVSGKGKVHVRGVSIDGINVPNIALAFFVEKFLTPKYPNVGIDSEFELTDRIDGAVIGYHKLTVTQR